MKELYICIFEKFNLSLQETNIFDYNNQEESTVAKLQKAFSYFKSQSRDEKIMFMQFMRNLQRAGEQYSAALNTQKVLAQRPASKPFVFISLHNLNVMMIADPTQQLYSFICVQASSESAALADYASAMARSYSVDIARDRCTFFGDCRIMTAPGAMTDCAVVFYTLTQGELAVIEAENKQTVFKNVNDPALLFHSSFVCVSPFVSSIQAFIQRSKNLVTRTKSDSAPVRLAEKSAELVSEIEKAELNERLRDFERSLDDVLRKYNLLN